MLDIDQHYYFTGDDESKLISMLDNDYLVYYFTDKSWPIPASDTVAVMSVEKNDKKNEYVYSVTSTPEQYKNKGFRRFESYEMTYQFKKVSNTHYSVVLHSKVTPPFSVPKWMMNAAFPGAGFDLMEALIGKLKQ